MSDEAPAVLVRLEPGSEARREGVMTLRSRGRRLLAGCLVFAAAILGGAGGQLLGLCGPFTDVANDAFCAFVLEIFYLGVTTGTTATTYDPASNVSRLQMAAFLARTVDGALRRGSRRAALDQFWATQNATALGLTTVGPVPHHVRSDGADLWVGGGGVISRVRASDGKLLETWTGAPNAEGALVAMGKVFFAGTQAQGRLYRIDPTAPAGAVDIVVSDVGGHNRGLAFDGALIWTGNTNSVSLVTPSATIPWTVTTVTTGFGSVIGMLYDGSSVWAADNSFQAIRKLNPTGAILQTVTVGSAPQYPVFDGSNIWVPNTGS